MENITAMVYNRFSHADVIEPLAENEKECLEEIRCILTKYDKLDRFGITLLHKHFELFNDEILIETTDEETRQQIIQPMKKSDLDLIDGSILETSWALKNSETLVVCQRSCVKQDHGHYSGVHVKTF
ncbi:hypothetical protein [Mucilaginibacter polytrichastri]|uniref:hypothetical protein n=1 Tax=Mucilaginibacter polytrichastri TaxID=1302689 RepID=UPI0008E077E4|nr:hypothetical protein [Mucilaginibacter polytrichastri]SFT08699.1 hypothetical protein SAMN04487890_11051 [Mucilaginibacter polytrichastri]